MFIYQSSLSNVDIYFLDYTKDSSNFDKVKDVILGLVHSFEVIETPENINKNNKNYNKILIVDVDEKIDSKRLIELSNINKYIPVVLLSHKSGGIEFDKVFGYSFDYFIINDFDKDVLVSLLNNIVVKQEQDKKLNDLSLKLEKKNKELEDKVLRTQMLANYDHLTNLPNRRFFTDKVQESIIHAKNKNKKLALMFIDLDNFKYVNDSLGHEIGDKLLQSVTQRIQTLLNPHHILSRLGGDEFTIIIQEYKSVKELETLALQIINSLKKAFFIDNKEIFIGSSIGISLYPENSIDYKELIKFADTAMYYVKNHGKNSFVFFNRQMTEFSNERLVIETNLRKSIENSEFSLVYQPKINLSTNTTLSVEALVRFENIVLKDKALSKCIEIAEDTGLIIPITGWILETSCQQLQKLKDLGYGFLRVAVNISTRMFKDDKLVFLIDELLQKYELEPKNLEIEITETTIMDYLEKSIEVLQKLADMGIKIAIDDFGTGYSSMSYLKTLPIDFIKIDKSFISEIHTKKGKAIVTAIIAMAKSLDIKIVAEGVEDIFQLELLKQKGCDIVQGYYYSKPLNQSDFIECIIKQDELNKELDSIHKKVSDILNSKKMNIAKDISIIKFSISGFSLVGREYGYEKENYIIEQISNIVRMNIRCDDIYARTCSEEFFVIVQTAQDIARKLADRIKEAIKEYDFGIFWKLSPSYYILEVNENDTKESLIERIDRPVCKL